MVSKSQTPVSIVIMIVVVIGLAALSRLIPHPPNFTPLAALALFAGRELKPMALAIIVPLAAMLLSDLVLGLHELSVVVYGAMVLSVLAGRILQGQNFGRSCAVIGLNSLVFFVVTNLAVWLTSGMYARTGAGLFECFTMAIPFLHLSLAGDFFYSGILLGGTSLIRRSFRSVSVKA